MNAFQTGMGIRGLKDARLEKGSCIGAYCDLFKHVNSEKNR
jgi:hypothetical protein